MKKKIILPTMFALSILVVGILATNVSAQEANYPPIVAKIADKFNLNVSEVQKVYDEERDERRAEMFANLSDKLDDLVVAGKLTQTQKEALLDKHEEMRDQMDVLRELSPEERRQKKKEIHEGFRSWLESEGIDISVMPMEGYRKGFKQGYGLGRVQ